MRHRLCIKIILGLGVTVSMIYFYEPTVASFKYMELKFSDTIQRRNSSTYHAIHRTKNNLPEEHGFEISDEAANNVPYKGHSNIPIKAFGNYPVPAPDCDGGLLMFNLTTRYGLGDRLRGIISAFMMALWTNRSFGIIKLDNCPFQDYFLPNEYDWNKCNSRVNFSSNDVGRVTLTGETKVDMNSDIWKRRVVVLFTNQFFEDNIPKQIKLPWLRNKRYSKMFVRNVLYHFLFKLEPYIQRKLNYFINNITKNGSLDLVGVHIRYLKISEHPENIEKVFKWMEKYNDIKRYAIYFASDELSLRKRALDRFKGSHSLEFSGKKLHVGRNNGNCYNHHFAVFEQNILARSDVIIKTPSSFSELSRIIRGKHGILYMIGRGPDEVFDYEK